MKKLSNDLRKKQCKEAIKISETKIRKHEKTSYHIEVFIKSNNKSRSHNRKLDRSRSRSTDRKINQKKYSLEFKEKVVADYLTDNALSLGEITNKYNIPKSCIGEWIHNKTLLDQA